MTPQQYQKRGDKIQISYAHFPTPLGKILIAATDRGLCFLQFGETLQSMLEELRKEFPDAELIPMNSSSSKTFNFWMKHLSSYLKGEKRHLDLPLDIRGTPFQLKVWKYLQTIPFGTVQSYRQVAHGIGKPKASRAVASACARNNVSLVIPCHRVLRGTGELAGYRWGLERKRALIELEQK